MIGDQWLCECGWSNIFLRKSCRECGKTRKPEASLTPALQVIAENTPRRKQFAPKPGFDWSHVTWGKPDSPPSALCSYCSAGIGEDDVPLIIWKPDGSAAQFCDECLRRWWGFS